MRKIYLLVLVVITLFSCSKQWSEGSKREFIKSCTTMSIQNKIPEDKVTDYCYCLLEKTMMRYDEDNWISEVSDDFMADADITCLIESDLEVSDSSAVEVNITGGF